MAFASFRRAPEPGEAAVSLSVDRADQRYPAQLVALPVPPALLWVKGTLPAAGEKLLAVVGSRAASGDGCRRAWELGRNLARLGYSVVSGGAFGIDAAAHDGALQGGAKTYAVLGCGIDIVYPDRHAALFERIAARGGLLSEYRPGTQPRRGQFPVRNRIIAALAKAVIVAEAALRSGALITAARACELGRLVLAMPGSRGADSLIESGRALAVGSAADVVAALGGKLARPAKPAAEPGPHAALIAAIADGADTATLLCRRLGQPLAEVLGALALAELDGFIARAASDTYEVVDRAC